MGIRIIKRWAELSRKQAITAEQESSGPRTNDFSFLESHPTRFAVQYQITIAWQFGIQKLKSNTDKNSKKKDTILFEF